MGNETDDFRKHQKSIEQLDAEHQNDLPAGATLPVTWKDGHTGRTMPGRPLHVIQPSDGEVEVFGAARAATCGGCKYYDLEGGRKSIVKQRFMERLVREEQWKPHHMGDVESAGICRERPTMVVTYISKACDGYRPRNRR